MKRLSQSIWGAILLFAALWTLSSPSCSCTDTRRSQQQESDSQLASANDVESDSTATGPPEEKSRGKHNADKQRTAAKSDVASPARDDSPPTTDPAASQSSTKTKPGAVDPGTAKQMANQLSLSAERLAADGKYSKAFLDARNAWVLASRFRDDRDCNALAEELIEQMRVYGNRANSKPSSDSKYKMLIVN